MIPCKAQGFEFSGDAGTCVQDQGGLPCDLMRLFSTKIVLIVNLNKLLF